MCAVFWQCLAMTVMSGRSIKISVRTLLKYQRYAAASHPCISLQHSDTVINPLLSHAGIDGRGEGLYDGPTSRRRARWRGPRWRWRAGTRSWRSMRAPPGSSGPQQRTNKSSSQHRFCRRDPSPPDLAILEIIFNCGKPFNMFLFLVTY